jgi:transcriptional regulator with XRE-family HTH domain
MPDIGKAIKEIRTARGFTQRDIAEKLSIPQSNYYQQYEKNGANYTVDKLMEMSKILDISIREILVKSSSKKDLKFIDNEYFEQDLKIAELENKVDDLKHDVKMVFLLLVENYILSNHDFQSVLFFVFQKGIDSLIISTKEQKKELFKILEFRLKQELKLPEKMIEDNLLRVLNYFERKTIVVQELGLGKGYRCYFTQSTV